MAVLEFFSNRQSCSRFPSQLVKRIAFCIAWLVWQPTFSSADLWTDASGKNSVEAEFVSFEKGVVVLRRESGKQISVPYEKLSDESRERIDTLAKEKDEDQPIDATTDVVESADAIESMAKDQRKATHALARYEIFLARADLAQSERKKAEEQIDKWRERAQKNLWRWGRQWVSLDRIRKDIEDEDRLIQEAHRFIEIGNDEFARERFEKASKKNPESIRGDFYLGILHALVGRNASKAKENFSKCVSRLERNLGGLSGIGRSNLIAALNNRAICLARLGKHSQAMKDWDAALELAPLTPELVQNLGYYAKLASMVSGWGISRSAARRVADQYARVTVANRSAAFVENVGWLFVPYIDAPLLTDFEDIQFIENEEINEERLDFANMAEDNELRIASWATGVAVDEQHILTTKKYVQGAYGLWVTEQGKLRRDVPGKIVAVSDDSNLALLRFRGLHAKALPLARQETTRADDFWVVSFPEPGLLGNGPQIVNGVVTDLKSSGPGYGFIYDLQLNRGGEGSPLLNMRGRVIGVDLGPSRLAKSAGARRSATDWRTIQSFLASTGQEFPATEANRGEEEVVDIEKFLRATADSSVYQIAIIGRAVRLSWTERIGNIRGISAKEGWNALEDPWCVLCNGSGDVLCQSRGCREGKITNRERFISHYLPVAKTPVYKWKKTFESCPSCGGKGVLTCPHCRGHEREPTL